MRVLLYLILLSICGPVLAAERIPVIIELVLALDASASVNNDEFQLQLEGVARAFQDQEVLKAIDQLKPLGAAVSILQWGGPGDTHVIVPFTHISNGRESKAFGFLTGLTRRWTRASSTSIATGIHDSLDLLEANDFEGSRLVIDISGDGQQNTSPSLEDARERARAAYVTINGLPIEVDDRRVSDYYRDHVIVGPDAFIEPAKDYEDYIRAIREKLLRELRPLGY